MTSPIRLGRAFATVGLWTMVSRVLGFVRDVMIAAFLGAGPAAEAFLVAFSLPNMFRRIFAEGALNMAFVPMFAKKLESGENAAAFARDAFSGLFGVLIVFVLLAQIFMPWLVLAMAWGFAGDARFDLTVFYGRITFCYILFISLAALLSGVLNATGRFVAAAAAPALLNAVFIATMLVTSMTGWATGDALAFSVPVAGVFQLVLVWWAASRAGVRLIPRMPRVTSDLRRLAIIMAPAALAGGVVQINLLIGRQVASFFDGAIVWLSLADRLYQLPLGVVGIAIGIVLLPDLSRKLRADDVNGSRHALNRAAEMSMALTLPCAVALVVIPVPLVEVLFQRGAFGAADTASTAAALGVYALGLPAFVLQKVLQPLFFAREDTRRPFRYALVSLTVNAGLAFGLAPAIGYLAAALGATCAAWSMIVALMWGSRNMGTAARFDARFKTRVRRMGLSSAIMGAALWGGMSLLEPALDLPSARYIALSALIVLGMVVYFGACEILGAVRLRELRSALRR